MDTYSAKTEINSKQPSKVAGVEAGICGFRRKVHSLGQDRICWVAEGGKRLRLKDSSSG